MVIDKLENLEKYVSLNPLFAEAVAFLKATDLHAHEAGKVVLKEGELMVNLQMLVRRRKRKHASKRTMISLTSRFRCRVWKSWGICHARICLRLLTMQKRTLPSMKGWPLIT